jgi:hypothetical protein
MEDIEKLKNNLTNVALNYPFFEFQSRENTTVILSRFPIKRIRSFNNIKAVPFYKNITRSIPLSILENEAK